MKYDFPQHIVQPISNKAFKLTPSIAYLLSKTSGNSLNLIQKTIIYPRSYRRYIPWYSSASGGGAITMGSKNWHTITFTENFFSNNRNKYPHSAYAKSSDHWMNLISHEVGHIHHTQKYGNIIIYLMAFAFQYIRYGHSRSPLENEAEHCAHQYRSFRNWVNRNLVKSSLNEFLQLSIPEDEKIARLEKWWAEYSENKPL